MVQKMVCEQLTVHSGPVTPVAERRTVECFPSTSAHAAPTLSLLYNADTENIMVKKACNVGVKAANLPSPVSSQARHVVKYAAVRK